MLLIIILLILLAIVAVGVFGQLKNNLILMIMNICFLGMVIVMAFYFIKIGGLLPAHSKILLISNVIAEYIQSTPIKLHGLAVWGNIFRFGFAYCFFLHALQYAVTIRRFFRAHVYMYAITIIPLIAILVLSHPTMMYGVFTYNYQAQRAIINFSFIIILCYLCTGAFCLFHELGLISLSWYKKRHINNIVQMVLLSIPYIIFAQFDPVMIYQDYMRVSVVLKPVLLVNSSPLAVWILTIIIAIIALIFMLIQNFRFLKFDYDRSKLEFNIKQKVTNAEITASMLLHGLKNQLLSAKILSRKLRSGLADETVCHEDLVETSEKLFDITEEMMSRLTYLYRTINDVKTVLVKMDNNELFDLIKDRVAEKDVDGIVSFSVADGNVLADKELMAEAVFNIVSNAIDAVRDKEYKKIVVRMFYTRTHNVISIADNGSGIDSKLKGKLFMPFTSSKNTNTNWGLGLCYARRIVKQHMGEIRFESEIGQGTTFYISLPRYF